MEDIYIKALSEYPIKEKLNKKAVGTYDANYPRRKAFVAGAEWMQYEMIENPDGGALLYAVVKTTARTKKEMIKKAVEWIKSQIYIENIFEYDNDEQPIKYICASCCDSVDEFIEKFKQAMQDESK